MLGRFGIVSGDSGDDPLKGERLDQGRRIVQRAEEDQAAFK